MTNHQSIEHDASINAGPDPSDSRNVCVEIHHGDHSWSSITLDPQTARDLAGDLQRVAIECKARESR